MPIPSKWSDIHVQGVASYRLGEGPFWQGSEARPGKWWHPKAVLASDFLNLRYMREGAAVELASAIATTRSSSHLLADAAGVYRSFGVNELAIASGVGAWIGGQVTNMAYPSGDLSDSRWTKVGGTISIQIISVLSGAENCAVLAENDLDSSHGLTLAASPRPVLGASVGVNTLSFGLEAGTRRYVVCGAVGGGLFAWVTIDTQTWAVTETGGTHYVDHRLSAPFAGGARVIELLVNNSIGANAAITGGGSSSATAGNNSPSYSGNGSTIICWGIGATPGRVFGPCIPTTTATATRFASDVKAVAAGAEPFAGFAANALGTATSMLAAVNLSRIGDGVVRHVAELSDGTPGNRLRLFIDTDDKPAAQVTSGNIVVASAKLGSALAVGRCVLAANFDPANGLYLVCKSGLQDAAASLAAMPAGLNLLRIGSGQSGLYLNDLIEQLQVCRVLTQAEARAWVQLA